MKTYQANIILISLSLFWIESSHAQRYTPVALCAIANDSTYESITQPITLGGEYPSGSTQPITILVGDTLNPGAPQASTGDLENVVIFLDTNNDTTPELLTNDSCTYNQSASPPGCSVTQNISIPTVTEDTTYRGRVMLSYNNLTPLNGCGNNSYGDSVDYLIVANVNEVITLTDISAPEDGGPVTVTATLSHNVSDGAGFVPFTVNYQTLDGTATSSDDDYMPSSGTLTFNGQAGDTQTFTVTPIADSVPEGDQTLTVQLSNLSNSTHGIDISDTATITLTEDDQEVALQMVKTVNETAPNIGDTLVFTLTVNNAGPSTAVNASVEDIVPAGFSSISPASVPPGTAFNVTGNTINWTGIDIPPSGTITATFTAVVLAP